MPAVGIDLGTTNSAVAILKGRPVIVEDSMGNRTLPSAVGWDNDIETLIIGLDAKKSPEIYNTILSVKRKMGTTERVKVGPHHWLPEEVSAEILKLLKQQVEEKTGEEVTEAIITVPAYFSLAQKAATQRAGELAGLTVQQLLPEPSAAVMAYGPQQDEKILVYDLGGGTFDITIIDYFAGALTTLAVTGNNFLGGDDFDRRIIDHFKDLIKRQSGVAINENDLMAMSVLKKAAEDAKIEMSRKPGARISLPRVTTVGGKAVGLDLVLKTPDFNAMIRDLVDGTIREVEKALSIAKLQKSQIDTVLLVGGSTYCPLVQETVRKFFGKEPNRSVNPDLAVALGAAASLVATVPERRHTVSCGFIPESTPDPKLEVSGRTTPRSRVRITGGASLTAGTANDRGEYSILVPLKKGTNALTIEAVSTAEEKAVFNPEPVVMDPQAQRYEEPPAPPAPILSRALSISHGDQAGSRNLSGLASAIMAAQTELPRQVTNNGFVTSVSNQDVLEGLVLEGDLPIAELNTRLASIKLNLPPNVPAGARVVVQFMVDENGQLTAELEVPSVNRRGKVQVNLKSPAEQVHILQQLEDLYTRVGSRLRPEERSGLEQTRAALESSSAEFDRQRNGSRDATAMWDSYNRIKTLAQKLRDLMADARRKLT